MSQKHLCKYSATMQLPKELDALTYETTKQKPTNVEDIYHLSVPVLGPVP